MKEIKKQKSTKSALITSVLSLVLCMSMLIGTTFAWFTDSVTSGNNIIKSGTLEVALEYKDMADEEYQDASEGAIFDYDLWEPGYVQIKQVKVSNLGSLAFKYQMNIYSNIQPVDGEVNLADVIDVYVFEGERKITRGDLVDVNKVGTLTGLMNSTDVDGAIHGVLLPDGEEVPEDQTYVQAGDVTVTIALKMQETAGNEYQDLSVGDGFSVQLLATQYTYEEDSFDETYDADAEFDPNQAVPMAKVEKATELIGKSASDLTWNNSFSMVNKDSNVVFDTAYVFTAPVDGETAKESPYASWLADFTVSFSRDVTANDEVGIAGEYGDWNWIGFLANDKFLSAMENSKLEAGKTYDLLGSYGIPMNYEELCEYVKVFNCAAWAGDEAEGLTMTVELRLYETYAPEDTTNNSANVKTGEYITIGSYEFTF